MCDLRVNRVAIALFAGACVLGCATATETQVHGSGGTTGSGGFGADATGGTSTGGSSTGGTSSGGSSGGTGNAAGATGTTGGTGGTTGGTGGTTGGTGGTTGGTGGSGGAVTGCANPATIQVGFTQRATDLRQISFDLFVRPSSAVQLSQIAVQYYFSNEEDSTLSVNVNSSDVNGGACGSGPSGYQSVTTKGQIIDDPNSTNPADKIVEFTTTTSGTITSGDCYFIRVDVQPSNYSAPNQDQTNDYSYSTQTTGAAWDHVTATVGGTLAWGCTP